jgi:hypothetical protein
MALQSHHTWLWAPPAFNIAGLAFATGFAIDASGEKVAIIGQVPKSGTLDKFEFRLATVTQAPANGLKCSFQNVSATDGAPDGTPDEYRVVTTGLTSNAWVAPGLMTSDGTDGGVKRSVTQGDRIACVIEFESFSASDNLQIAAMSQASNSWPVAQNPYSAHFTASWALNTPQLVMILKYSDGTYELFHPSSLPMLTLNAQSLNSGSGTNEIALYFQVPFACKIGGVGYRADMDGDCDIVLYDSDGTTPLATASTDKDIRGTTGGNNGFARFPSDVTLSINTNYRLSMKPTTVTNITLYTFDVNAVAILGALEGGTAIHYSAKTAGVWGQTATRRPLIFPWITALDDGAGGAAATVGHVIGGAV